LTAISFDTDHLPAIQEDPFMRSTSRLRKLLALVFAIALVAAACGRDDDSSSGDDNGGGGGDDGGGESAGPATTDDCIDYQATQGVSDDSIKLGSSFPKSGLYQAFSKIATGYEAWFQNLNDNEDGIGGRQIEMITEDDEYSSGNTQQNYQKLTQSDGVFATFGVVGTANNLAIREQQNEECIPNLFASTGYPGWGDPDAYPWTIGSIPTYNTEMAMWVAYLQETKPDATIAVLYQNDDFGKAYLDALKPLIEGTDLTIVAEEAFDAENADVAAQLTTLADSGADAFVSATTALACANAMGGLLESSWRPLAYISATCISSTITSLAPPGAPDLFYSGVYLKDPNDPTWADDEGMLEFQEVGAASGLTPENLLDGVVVFGWTLGQLLQQTFENAETIDRQSVMNAAWSLDNVELPMLLPGITVNTDGADDPFPIEQMQLGKYNGTYWALEGEIFDNEGESGDIGG
jgi:branched-chain amino acid transport system substrate-binding protein